MASKKDIEDAAKHGHSVAEHQAHKWLLGGAAVAGSVVAAPYLLPALGIGQSLALPASQTHFIMGNLAAPSSAGAMGSGLAGAIPPLLGWTAVTNEIHPHALILVLIIFVWTPPHFWALAIHRRDDYARAEIPMLPVTHGIDFTKTSIVLYTILLITATVLPYPTGMSGIVYLIGALILGSWFLAYTLKLKFRPAGDTAIRTFGVSIFYLVLLFSLLLADH